MRESDEGHRSGKATKGALREARLAAKLRQNLARRKEKTRAVGRAADRASAPAKVAVVPPDDGGEGG
jgi:hypothetical protein